MSALPAAPVTLPLCRNLRFAGYGLLAVFLFHALRRRRALNFIYQPAAVLPPAGDSGASRGERVRTFSHPLRGIQVLPVAIGSAGLVTTPKRRLTALRWRTGAGQEAFRRGFGGPGTPKYT
jgi:hypothetical protein